MKTAIKCRCGWRHLGVKCPGCGRFNDPEAPAKKKRSRAKPPLGGPDAAGSTERVPRVGPESQSDAPATGWPTSSGPEADTASSEVLGNVEGGRKVVGARSKNFFGKPLPGWLDPQDVEAAWADCLEILQKQAEAGVAPLARKGGGEAGSALLLIFDDFRDRYSDWLRKGAA